MVEQEGRSVWDKQSPNGIHYQIRWRVTPNNWIVTKDTEQNLMSISGISVRTSSLVVTNRSASEEQVGHPSALHQPRSPNSIAIGGTGFRQHTPRVVSSCHKCSGAQPMCRFLSILQRSAKPATPICTGFFTQSSLLKAH